MHAACSFHPSRRAPYPLVCPRFRLPLYNLPMPHLPSTTHPAAHLAQWQITSSNSNPKMAVTSGIAFTVRPSAPAPAVRPCAAAGGARARADGPGAKWWAPLLGWSGQPDYIDAQPAAAAARAEDEEEHPPRARRFGVLTEDKARQLRTRMMETESFHDAMYHSAIASRLASAAPDGRGH